MPAPAEVAVLRDFVKNRPATLPTESTEAAPASSDTPSPLSLVVAKSVELPVHLVNFNTRLSPDVDAALRRASLERKLNRQSPHTIQEIVDEALRPWLLKHGYLQNEHPTT